MICQNTVKQSLKYYKLSYKLEPGRNRQESSTIFFPVEEIYHLVEVLRKKKIFKNILSYFKINYGKEERKNVNKVNELLLHHITTFKIIYLICH